MMIKREGKTGLWLRILNCFLLASWTIFVTAIPSINLLESGKPGSILQVQSIPNSLTTSNGIVTIIYSPGTSSSLIPEDSSDTDGSLLSLVQSKVAYDDDVVQVICRGSTLQGTTEIERSALAFSSVVSDSILVDGIALNDMQSFRQSRHSRTLTALFRSKLVSGITKKQMLVLVLDGCEESDIELLKAEVLVAYQATAIERSNSPTFDELYDLRIFSDATKALAEARAAAKKLALSEAAPISTAFAAAWSAVQDDSSDSTIKKSLGTGLDPPHVATAYVLVMNAHVKYMQSAMARINQWKKRVARGLWIDSFGAEATKLRQRCLTLGYDVETLSAAGLPQVGQFRYNLRNQIQSTIDAAITDIFNKQVANIQASTVKRLQASLLKNYDTTKNTYESNEASINANAALLRQQTFAAESILDDIAVPDLSLTKDNALRTISEALNDAYLQFPDSPAAKLKRTQQVSKVVSKETKNKKKKPGQRSFGFGLDLVAMIRPDGFGTLQGFAGYALPGGNTITVGLHNDADDPQVIAQFGGVRPPLLRVQPKLRLDVEL